MVPEVRAKKTSAQDAGTGVLAPAAGIALAGDGASAGLCVANLLIATASLSRGSGGGR
jgi:hypothetical protein